MKIDNGAVFPIDNPKRLADQIVIEQIPERIGNKTCSYLVKERPRQRGKLVQGP